MSLPTGTLWTAGGKTAVTDAAAVGLAGDTRAFYLDGKGAVWSIDPTDAAARPSRFAPGPFTALSVQGTNVDNKTYLAVAIDSSGAVWQWGRPYGVAGTDQARVVADVTYQIDKPAKVGGVSDATAVSTNGSSVFALRRDGTVTSWGENTDYRPLGRTVGEKKTSEPAPIASLRNVKAISAGSPASFAVDASGALWGWGSNNYGLLTARADDDTGGKVVKVPLPGAVRSVSSGQFSAAAVLQDGRVAVWGDSSALGIADAPDSTSAKPQFVRGVTGGQQVWFGDQGGVVQTAGGLVGFGDRRIPSENGGFDTASGSKPLPWAGARVLSASFPRVLAENSYAFVAK